jgi:hypothetical protein
MLLLHPRLSTITNKPVQRTARVNNIIEEDADRATDVVLGTLPVNSKLTKVLFDTGASHSFVSESFAHMHELSMMACPPTLWFFPREQT